LSLVGTLIGSAPDEQVALLLDTSTQNTVRLCIGEDHHGWVLSLVNPRDVTLVRDGKDAAVLELPQPGEAGAAGKLTVVSVTMPTISHEVSADEQPIRRRPGR
jgi:general secretion pathway protein N